MISLSLLKYDLHHLLQQQISDFSEILHKGNPNLYFNSHANQIKNKCGNRGRNYLFGNPLEGTDAVRLWPGLGAEPEMAAE